MRTPGPCVVDLDTPYEDVSLPVTLRAGTNRLTVRLERE